MNTAIKLHPVKRSTKASNTYCGPSVLSILTGLDTQETARLLREVSGRTRIRGTSRSALTKALGQLGYLASSISSYGTARHCPTLNQWSKAYHRNPAETYLLVVGNHWAVVQGRRYACGMIAKPCFISASPKRRARVTDVWRLEHVANMKPAAVIPPAPPKAAPVPERIEAKALAARYNVSLESVSMYDRLNPEDDGVFVYPPKGLCDEDTGTDPYDGEHVAYDWPEGLERVKTYVALVTAKQRSELADSLVALT